MLISYCKIISVTWVTFPHSDLIPDAWDRKNLDNLTCVYPVCHHGVDNSS